ncbi:hypothetical protein RSJ42_08995 [Methanosarcina hadiensis]|uniref:hypothetical protein n=1 Tax=Methanosarcina hadiensis TaxID=3078083 RepID=UPI003977DF3E
MEIPVFLSYAKPFNQKQKKFISKVAGHLVENGFKPRTLGITDNSTSAPLIKIREIINECHGLLSVAFRRGFIEKGVGKPNTDLAGHVQYDLSQKWITSPYCQIEPSMAFQVDMPILIFREKGVIDDGILEKGVVGSYMPEFDLDLSIDQYFKSSEWIQLITEWKKSVLEYKMRKQFKSNVLVHHIISCCICEEKEISFDHLYNAFKMSIDREGYNHYERFAAIIGADGNFESRYRIPRHSLQSDYIFICNNVFKD